MKSSPILLKIITLCFFVFLVSALVAYKAGALDPLLYGNGYAASVNTLSSGNRPLSVDTPPPENDLIMPSTKSFIIDDGHTPSNPPPQQTQRVDTTIRVREEYMGSSKSARVFTPPVDTTKKAPK